MIQILHNPRCAKSRETLKILQASSADIEIVEYLKDVPTVSDLEDIINKLGIKPFDLVRRGETIFKEQFKGKSLTDREWVEAMVQYPKLIERPIVIKGDKAELGRPPERVLSLLK
ncbi:MAG: arsenate reductase [Roseivirga sp.]|jgi:arsenate reductase